VVDVGCGSGRAGSSWPDGRSGSSSPTRIPSQCDFPGSTRHSRASRTRR
jgi:hypothetical protein